MRKRLKKYNYINITAKNVATSLCTLSSNLYVINKISFVLMLRIWDLFLTQSLTDKLSRLVSFNCEIVLNSTLSYLSVIWRKSFMLVFLHFLIVAMLCTWVQVSLLSLHTRLLTNTNKHWIIAINGKMNLEMTTDISH